MPQTDVISAEFSLAAARQLQHQYQTAIANDETALNLQLYRPLGSPLAIYLTLKNRTAHLPARRAYRSRLCRPPGKILEAALTERNANTALYLAKMEYLPDFTAGVQYDDYPVSLRPIFGSWNASATRLGWRHRFQSAGFFLDEAGRGRRAREGQPRSSAV